MKHLLPNTGMECHSLMRLLPVAFWPGLPMMVELEFGGPKPNAETCVFGKLKKKSGYQTANMGKWIHFFDRPLKTV